MSLKCLAVHPGPLMYTKIYLRLEPLGLELVAEAMRQAGHEVRLLDLQVDTHTEYFKVLDEWKPAVVAFSCNYLANVPEIVDLAKLTKDKLPTAFVFVGGHSASFVARDFLSHGQGAIEDLERINEPGIFIVDDVAFIQAEHGFKIGEAIARKGIKKQYYLETRGDTLLRNKEVFAFWKTLGLEYMFLGIEAIDEEGLKKHRKRISLGKNFEALEYARSLGIMVAINLIADPDWDRQRFEVVREWCLEIPEIVTISVNTPYPGTETWLTESEKVWTRDYRLYDIQHAVLPTRLPLFEFYTELVKTQDVLNKKHLGWAALKDTLQIAAGHLLRGQTNFIKMLWKFNSVYNPNLQYADHQQPVKYEMALPPAPRG